MPAASWALRPAETIISRESEKKSIPTHHHYGPVDNSNLTVLLVPKQRLEQQLTQQKKTTETTTARKTTPPHNTKHPSDVRARAEQPKNILVPMRTSSGCPTDDLLEHPIDGCKRTATLRSLAIHIRMCVVSIIFICEKRKYLEENIQNSSFVNS
jgi:hypothetical protein